jgi:transposase
VHLSRVRRTVRTRTRRGRRGAAASTKARPTTEEDGGSLADRTRGKSGLMKEEREELTRLRKDVRELRMERDVLKKAGTFFAKDHL